MHTDAICFSHYIYEYLYTHVHIIYKYIHIQYINMHKHVHLFMCLRLLSAVRHAGFGCGDIEIQPLSAGGADFAPGPRSAAVAGLPLRPW